MIIMAFFVLSNPMSLITSVITVLISGFSEIKSLTILSALIFVSNNTTLLFNSFILPDSKRETISINGTKPGTTFGIRYTSFLSEDADEVELPSLGISL